MIVGDVILSVLNFLTQPTWHLVVIYVILLLLVVAKMLKTWGFLK
jgi:hypothetical protein